jgi:type IV secretory pathway VirJ component
VDTDLYYATLAKDGKACDQLVGDAEGLSRQLQHAQSTQTYEFPILAGIGEGGALAVGVLGEAPGHTLSGAAAIDPAASLHAPHPLCPGPPGAPFGFDETATRGSTGEAEALIALLAPHLTRPPAKGIEGLPLEELPADAPGKLMAVVLSGDGGWRDLDKSIAETLQQDGVSVVGWDSLRYFWSKKTPAETAADLGAVLEAYSARWHAERIALIGYSFGADVLPDTWRLLPDALKSRIVLVSLLALSPKADWEISVTGWLGAPPTAAALPVEPALSSMPVGILQCFYGAEETDSLCPALAARGVEVIRTSGGHHFDRDYAGLARRILERFRGAARR